MSNAKKGNPLQGLSRIIVSALEEFKESPHIKGRTLARIIYGRQPYLFNDIEDVRSRIKYFTKNQKNGKHRKPHIDSTPFQIPKGIDYNQVHPFIVPEKHSKCLIVCDLHSPFHDERALELAFNYAIKNNINCVVINGDAFDFHAFSRFPEDPKKRNPIFEKETNLELLKSFRRAFPGIKIYYKKGNHEIWWEKYLWHHAPLLTDLPTFDFAEIYELPRLEIELIDDKRPMHFGKLTGIHGHEMRGGGGVNISRGLFLKYVDNIFCGHFHRTSHHAEPTGRGHVIGTWSIGCLAKMHPDYMPINKWNHGFAILEWDKSEFEFHNYKIINGKIKGE